MFLHKYAGFLVQKHRFIISIEINNLSLQIAFLLLLLQTKPPAHNFTLFGQIYKSLSEQLKAQQYIFSIFLIKNINENKESLVAKNVYI